MISKAVEFFSLRSSLFVLQVKLNALALLRNPYRTVIITCPASIGVERIQVAVSCIGIDGDALHEVLVRLQGKISLLGKWNHAALIIHQRSLRPPFRG